MRFLLDYLWQRRRSVLLSLLFCLIFLCAFLLYRLPAGAVLYPAGVCTVIGVAALLRGVHRAKKKHLQLQKLLQLDVPLIDYLPEVNNIDDEDYQQVIAHLQEQNLQLRAETDRQYAEMVDYYTMWVHQIKTPISSMRLTLQNEDTALSRAMQEELMRIEQYVEMVLVFLRLDASSTDYLFQSCSLDRLVRAAVKKFAGQFIGRKIALDYQPMDAMVLTDEKWLSFVVEQLLSNALKYTPRGSIRIWLEQPLTLCIQDTGIGIAPEDLPRVFEKGYTGCNGRTDKKASGIGLYLCRRICQNLGHTIEIQSTPGGGTTVRLHMEREKLELE